MYNVNLSSYQSRLADLITNRRLGYPAGKFRSVAGLQALFGLSSRSRRGPLRHSRALFGV